MDSITVAITDELPRTICRFVHCPSNRQMRLSLGAPTQDICPACTAEQETRGYGRRLGHGWGHCPCDYCYWSMESQAYDEGLRDDPIPVLIDAWLADETARRFPAVGLGAPLHVPLVVPA